MAVGQVGGQHRYADAISRIGAYHERLKVSPMGSYQGDGMRFNRLMFKT